MSHNTVNISDMITQTSPENSDLPIFKRTQEEDMLKESVQTDSLPNTKLRTKFPNADFDSTSSESSWEHPNGSKRLPPKLPVKPKLIISDDSDVPKDKICHKTDTAQLKGGYGKGMQHLTGRDQDVVTDTSDEFSSASLNDAYKRYKNLLLSSPVTNIADEASKAYASKRYQCSRLPDSTPQTKLFVAPTMDLSYKIDLESEDLTPKDEATVEMAPEVVAPLRGYHASKCSLKQEQLAPMIRYHAMELQKQVTKRLTEKDIRMSKIPKEFKCKTCGLEFRVKSLLDGHMRLLHKKPEYSDNELQDLLETARGAAKTLHKCRFCDKSFALLNALHIHYTQYCLKIPPNERKKLHYPDSKQTFPKKSSQPEVPSMSLNVKKDEGEDENSATSKKVLKIRLQKKGLRCDICKISCATLLELSEHTRIAHIFQEGREGDRNLKRIAEMKNIYSKLK